MTLILKMKLPCERAIWYTLPRIRADITKELVKQGMSQNEVAEKLGVTPSAVSQYLHRKRGSKTKTNAEYREKIIETVKKIKNTENDEKLSDNICQCCMSTRPKKK